jgi:hypothetical protein
VIEFQSQLAVRFLIAFSMLSKYDAKRRLQSIRKLSSNFAGTEFEPQGTLLSWRERLEKLGDVFAHLVLPVRPVVATQGAPVIE